MGGEAEGAGSRQLNIQSTVSRAGQKDYQSLNPYGCWKDGKLVKNNAATDYDLADKSITPVQRSSQPEPKEKTPQPSKA